MSRREIPVEATIGVLRTNLRPLFMQGASVEVYWYARAPLELRSRRTSTLEYGRPCVMTWTPRATAWRTTT
jgi:hypothetical protein